MPLILGILNLLGMYAYPLGTNFFFILFFVFAALLAAYSSKPPVGGTYHFGPEEVESTNFANFAGRFLSISISFLEALGFEIKGLAHATRLVGTEPTGHILCVLFFSSAIKALMKSVKVKWGEQMKKFKGTDWLDLILSFQYGLGRILKPVCWIYTLLFITGMVMDKYGL